MNLGVLYKKEKYLSLNILNKDMILELKKQYNIILYKTSNNLDKDITNIENLYKKSDFVINLSSKCINYKIINRKPTLLLWHARMDHWAWINVYHNKDFISGNDIITFASQAALKKYRYTYPKWVKSFLLPYFTNIEKSFISSKEENNIRKLYNIPLNKKIIVYYGRFCSEKNIEKTIEIFNKLNRKDTCLLLIWNFSDEITYGFGDLESVWDKYKDKLLKLISKSKSNIILLTNIERKILIKILSFSYIYINMTKCYEEDFGISTIEAMKLGLPTICSDRWGTKDMVIHKKTGFLVKTSIGNKYNILYNYDNIIDYTNTILDDNTLYQKTSFEAKKRAESIYWKQKFIKNINNILLYIKNNNKIKIKENIICPKTRIKKIYDSAIKNKMVDEIYITNPKLFNKMYKFYISK